ncbi:ABC transporter permease [Micromonospora sp. DT81.3]|uniref:ABC transporter permease n=1 Tax=Actinomycetes TaxID=1760 RepID=UPI003CEEAC06
MNARAVTTRIGRMTGQALLTIAVVVVLVFLLVRLIPGDPVRVILGSEYSPEEAAELASQLNLDKSVPEQFLLYVGGLFRGDLGESTSQPGRSVADIIGDALPATAAIALAGIVIGVTVGIILGLLAALTRRRGVDLAVRTSSMITFSTPAFLVGLLLILVFSLTLGWLPAGGWPGTWPENFAYLILPGVALSTTMSTLVTRTVRQSAIDSQGQQYMEAAFMRGLPARVLTMKHTLPNSLLPVLTLIGISFATLLTGAIIVESVFGIPGLGSEMSQAVSRRDYPVIQGIALVSAIVVVISGYVVEIAYTFVDPRARTL